jgi:exopolysaccharide biosynthesis protein
MYVFHYEPFRGLYMRMKKLIPLFFIILLLAGCAPAPTVIVATPPPATPAPEPTPVPTPEPTPVPTPEPTPSPTPNPYFTYQEEVVADLDSGHWLYRSSTLYVDIQRTIDEENKQVYFVADVRVQNGERERSGFSTPKRPGGKSTDINKIVRYYKAVVAVNGDFLDNNSGDKERKGVIIRDGKVIVDKKKADTLAFMPDGSMKIFAAGETDADSLLAQGIQTTYSFGPTLINNGEIQEGLDEHRLRKPNPRTAVGYIEPNHYLLIVVEGRSSHAKGVTLVELAELFASYGCEAAYNLDGGASAAMTFMGEVISEYQGSTSGQRPVPDALMFGYSELVDSGD